MRCAGRLGDGDAIVDHVMSVRQASPDPSREAQATFQSPDGALDEG